MAKKSSVSISTPWKLEERRINYTVKELEEHGCKIFKSSTNRLQDNTLVNTFKIHLQSGGNYYVPGKLVNAKECFKARRVLYRQNPIRGKKSIKISSPSDFTEDERIAYNNGLALVVFDGNHRFEGMCKALKNAKSKSERDEIKSSVSFNYEDVPAGKLATTFLDINTQMSSMDRQDYIPYLLKNWGDSGDPIYEFDFALDALLRAKYTGLKSREGIFNFTSALLICGGGKIASQYDKKENLYKLAKKGKDAEVIPVFAQNAEAFKNYILVPYIFERTDVLSSRIRKDMVYKNKLTFLVRLLNVAREVTDQDDPYMETVGFVNWLCLNKDEIWWKDYISARTLRTEEGVQQSSNMIRDNMIISSFREYMGTEDYNHRDEIFNKIQKDFLGEVAELQKKEEQLRMSTSGSDPSKKGAYTTNHNRNLDSVSLSVEAMWKYENERDY